MKTITDTPVAKEKLALGSSLIASLLASLCCIGPLVAIGLGLGSFGLASFFETVRPYFLVATALLLGAAFYFTYRKQETVCEDGMCKTQGAGRWSKVILWSITPLVLAFSAFPYYSGVFVSKGDVSAPASKQPQAQAAITPTSPEAATLSTVTIKIEGMTCAGCAARVESTLKNRAGVQSVKVTLDPGQAVVQYDPNKVRPAQLVEDINALDYKASL